MELLRLEKKERKEEFLFSQETSFAVSTSGWDDHFQNQGTEENQFPTGEERVLSYEGFFPLKMGMKVRHPKFGLGRVQFVEGMDEEQKATILFQTAGSKRLKVRIANLEILEG
jgi:hypothetical protein